MHVQFRFAVFVIIFIMAGAMVMNAQGSLVNPTPTPAVSISASDDDELKAQEKILAELVFLRAEKLGWVEQRKGLEGQLQVKDREITIERERGDWFKKAAEAAQAMDKNAVKMDTNAVAIQTGLEGRISDKNARIAELTDNLRRCQTNQKWIAGVSAVAGGVGGFLLKGQTDRFLGTSPRFAPPSRPFELYRKQ